MSVTMPASPTRRCPRCGGTAGAGVPARRRCPACERRPVDPAGPPVLPAEFWLTHRMRAACMSRHLGRVSIAYRTHPAHDRRVSQATLAGWLGLRQAQVSLIESGPPVRDLDRLFHWAITLGIPERLLWFDLPGRRRPGLVAAGPAPVGAAGPPTPTGFRVPDDLLVVLRWMAAGQAGEGGPRAYDDLVPVLREWADTVRRREFLRTFGWAATAAATAGPPLAEPAREQPAAGATPARGAAPASGPASGPAVAPAATPAVDDDAIGRVEAVLAAAQRQDDALGPAAALQTVLAQRALVRTILPHCAPRLRPRLLSTSADVSRAAGWLSFDLRDFDAAAYYYDEARVAAEGAHDTRLGALVLCQLGLLAIWRGQPRLGVEHAAGARARADRTGDLALRAFARDIAARGYADADDPAACLTALDEAEHLIADADPRDSVAYFHNSSLLSAVRGRCLVALGRPAEGRRAIETSLTTMDGGFVRNVAFTQLDLARAYLGEGDVDAAAGAVGRARRLAVRNRSVRLAVALGGTRRQLEPWRDSAAVRGLDREVI
jgi:hypothetical protein